MLRILCFGLIIASFSCSKALRWVEIPFDQVSRELDESYGIKLVADPSDPFTGRAAQQAISSGEFVIARIDASHEFARKVEEQLNMKIGYRPPLVPIEFGVARVEWWPGEKQIPVRSYDFSPFPDEKYGKGTILLTIDCFSLSDISAVVLIRVTPKDRYPSRN